MESSLLVSTKDRITTITINRPEVRNSLNRETIELLIQAFEKISKEESCRAVILTSTGTEAFCAGADLSELHAATDLRSRETFFAGLAQLIKTMHKTPQTIIASIHGFALAGGCGLVAAADIALASEQAQFGLPELYIGLAPMVITPVLHRAIGRKALADLVLSADRIDAQRALTIGLVSRIFAPEQLFEATTQLAQRIASLAPQAAAASKRLVYEVAEENYQLLLNRLPNEVAKLSLEAEAQEGISAFLLKQKPRW
jgi:methylglutaconyl-CoA hydratase